VAAHRRCSSERRCFMLAVACGARGANASSITRESRDALEKFSRIKQRKKRI
jgi:hypothetical protein